MKFDQKRPHILITSSWMPTESQPFLGNFIVQFAREISKHAQVTLLQLLAEKSSSIDVKTEHLDELKVLKVRYPNTSKFIGQKNALQAAKAILESDGGPIDLIHHHVSVTKWWIPLYLKKAFKCPIITTEHSSIFISGKFNQLSPLMKAGVKKLYNRSSAITAVSNYLLNTLPKSKTKKLAIPNLLPQKWLTEPISNRAQSPYSFLHVSTVDENKQVLGILEAIQALRQSTEKPFHLTIISDEPTTSLQNEAKRLQVDSLVIFKGPLDHADLLTEYQKHHCFVLNSKVETFSIVNAEALACGLHLITTPVGFAAEIIDEEVIDLVEHGNKQSLVDAMQAAAEQGKLGGEEARKLVAHCSAKNVTEKYLDLYYEALSQSQS